MVNTGGIKVFLGRLESEENDNSLGPEELDEKNKTTEKSSENGVLGQQNEVIIDPEELDEENQKIEE